LKERTIALRTVGVCAAFSGTTTECSSIEDLIFDGKCLQYFKGNFNEYPKTNSEV